MVDIRRALRSGEPLDLLGQASTLLTLVDAREYGFARREGDPPYSLQELATMFLDVRRVETSGLLAVIAELAGDDLMAARIRRELAARSDPLPEWLARLDEAEVYPRSRWSTSSATGTTSTSPFAWPRATSSPPSSTSTTTWARS